MSCAPEKFSKNRDQYKAYLNADAIARSMITKDQRMKEATADDPGKIEAGAIKYDAGKSPIFRGCINYFPRACEQVASVSAFGATQYSWMGWRSVNGGYERYSDALVRHLISEGKGEVEDRDSGLLHAAHVAWNAMARLELLMLGEETSDACEENIPKCLT